MKTIVLISCVSKKRENKSQAKDLYCSPLFKKNLHYAESLKPDSIYILSALYGLVDLKKEIEPYDKTLNDMSKKENLLWADEVLQQLKKVADLQNDKFVFLAGNNYRKNLLPHIAHYSIPMEGLQIGKQLEWLTERLKNVT